MSLKNVLFIYVRDRGFFDKAFLDSLFNCISIENSYAVLNGEFEDKAIFKETWDASEIWHGHYYQYDKKFAFDRSFVDPISKYSIEILHMIERHEYFDFDVRTSLYYKHVVFWEHVLKEKEIDCVLFSSVPHESFDYVVYLLCKEMNIPVIYQYDDDLTGISDYFPCYLCDSLEKPGEELVAKYYELVESYQSGELDGEICEGLYRDYFDKIKNRLKSNDFSRLPYISEIRKEEISRYYDGPIKMWKEREAFIAKIKGFCGGVIRYAGALVKNYSLIRKYEKMTETVNHNEKYIFYAMHFQPEATSSPQGGCFSDQILAVQLLAASVPEGMKVYVKEHPGQLAMFRTGEYYEELNSIPNVVLVSQKIDSLELIKNCFAVATLTGTVIYEAQIAEKPCLCLGFSPRVCLPGVYEIGTVEMCKKVIDDICNGSGERCSETNLKLFWRSVELITFCETDTSSKVRAYTRMIKKQLCSDC